MPDVPCQLLNGSTVDNEMGYTFLVPIELQTPEWKFGRTRNASGECESRASAHAAFAAFSSSLKLSRTFQKT